MISRRYASYRKLGKLKEILINFFLFKSPYHDFESWLICEKILLVQTRNEFYIFKKNVSNKRYGLKGITCPNMNYCEDNLNGRGWRHLMTLLLLVSI